MMKVNLSITPRHCLIVHRKVLLLLDSMISFRYRSLLTIPSIVLQ
jgi:hypothetical protein